MLGKIGKWYSEFFLYKVSVWLTILARAGMLGAQLVNLVMVVIRKLLPALGLGAIGNRFAGGAEITMISMVFMACCACSYTWYTNGHVRVGLFRDMMKERPRTILDAVIAFACTGYIGFFVWSMYGQAVFNLGARTLTSFYLIPLGPFMAIFAVIMAHAFLVFMRSFIGLASKAMGKKFAHEPYLQGQ